MRTFAHNLLASVFGGLLATQVFAQTPPAPIPPAPVVPQVSTSPLVPGRTTIQQPFVGQPSSFTIPQTNSLNSSFTRFPTRLAQNVGRPDTLNQAQPAARLQELNNAFRIDTFRNNPNQATGGTLNSQQLGTLNNQPLGILNNQPLSGLAQQAVQNQGSNVLTNPGAQFPSNPNELQQQRFAIVAPQQNQDIAGLLAPVQNQVTGGALNSQPLNAFGQPAVQNQGLNALTNPGVQFPLNPNVLQQQPFAAVAPQQNQAMPGFVGPVQTNPLDAVQSLNVLQRQALDQFNAQFNTLQRGTVPGTTGLPFNLQPPVTPLNPPVTPLNR